MKRWIGFFILIALGAIPVGCGRKTQRDWDTLKECTQKNTDLSLQVQHLEHENTQLTEQVNTLSALDAAVRLEALDTLDKIRIGKRSGFYDKDDDGTNETLVVYLKPLDTAQDSIKAIGRADVGLWDLDDPNDSRIEVWEIIPEILHESWGGNILSSYYRFELNPKKTPQRGKEYTVKVTFTDYLSGKVLTDQKVLTIE